MRRPLQQIRMGTLLLLAATAAIAACAQSARIDPLLQGLSSKDAHVRMATLELDDNWSAPSLQAVPLLAQIAVKDHDPQARYQATSRIREQEPRARAALPKLTAALKSPREMERVWAIQALERLGPMAATAVDDIAATYSDTSGNVKFVAGEALYKIKHPTPASITALVNELRDPDMPAALNASTALGVMGEGAIGPLRRALKDPILQARQFAVFALASIGSSAVPELATALRDTSWVVRGSAISGLGAIQPRTEAVTKALEVATHDEAPELREMARQSLAWQPAKDSRRGSPSRRK
jgi:HEAT repeat protein